MKKQFVCCIMLIGLFTSCITASVIIAEKQAKGSKDTHLVIMMKDSTMVKGNFYLPKRSTPLVVVQQENGEKLNIPSDDIAYIYAWSAKGESERGVKMIYTAFKEYKEYHINKLELKYSKRKSWILCYVANTQLEFYVEAEAYKLENDGRIISTDLKAYLMRKTNDDLPVKYSTYPTDFFLTPMYKYFADCPNVIKAMREREAINKRGIDPVAFLLSEYERCSYEKQLNEGIE